MGTWQLSDATKLMQAALAAAQHGAGHSLRAAAPIMTPQVPRPPTSASLGLDLSSLRLHNSSPTPAPRPQKVRVGWCTAGECMCQALLQPIVL